MRLVAAPAGSGIVFRRVDLDGFEIPANGRNVARVSYATSLMRGSVLISTTEHLLSALIGFGVDNVIVEVDNLELPILDGSALPYIEAFQSVGLRAANSSASIPAPAMASITPSTSPSPSASKPSAATSKPATTPTLSRLPAPSASRKTNPSSATWA
jgi:UDP-3-O-acyl-N-acetylglucosamine deacetylase